MDAYIRPRAAGARAGDFRISPARVLQQTRGECRRDDRQLKPPGIGAER